MKKNFVKKSLASTLALAMVVTAMPASTASAAKAPALNRTTKTLYINENDIGSSYDFNIKNKVAKSTYKWTTSNKAVATVKSNGLTTAATKTGKATITCKITLPTKKTKTLKATVTVKENANKVVIKNAPEKEIGIGVDAYDFDSTQTTASGAKATDYRIWEIDAESNTAGATMEKPKDGKVTTTKAGSFKIRVRSYQNKAKLAANETIDSDWLEVKVVSSITGVTQTVTNKVKVTFDDNMKDKVKAENFVIKNKATTAVQQIKGISLSDDGKEVTIETYVNFADNGTYVLIYDEKEIEFNTSIGEVATLELTPTTVIVGDATKIEVVAKNANGVDITSEKRSAITIEDSENVNGWLDTSKSPYELTIFKVGATAKIKATYHTYKFDATGKEEGTVITETVVTAMDKSAATYSTTKYVIGNTGDSVNFDKVTENKNLICVEDANKSLTFKILDVNGNEIKNYNELSVESGNDNVLLVGTYDSTTHSVPVMAVKDGNTVVVIKDKDGKAIVTLTVVVKAKRNAATVVLDKSVVTVTNNNDTVVSKATVKATVKDQYGDDYSNVVTVDDANPISKPANTTVFPTVKPASDGTLTINANAANAGTYQYKVSSGDKFTVLNVSVKAVPTTGSDGYRFEVASNTADAVVTGKDDINKTINIQTIKTKGGVDTQGLASGTAVTYTVTDKDGKDASALLTTDANGKDVFVVTTVDSNGIVKKTATGTYLITAKNIPDNKVIGKTTISVSDTQAKATFKANTLTTDSVATDKDDQAGLQNILNTTCEFYYNGKTYSNSSNSTSYSYGTITAQVTGKKVYVSKAIINIRLDAETVVPFEVSIQTTFTMN